VLRKHPNLRVVLTGSPDERALADHVLGEVAQDVRSRVSNVAGITDLRGLSGVLEASTALLCNDTGVMHLARATGVPLVAVLGPENDRRWGPYPDGAAPVEALRHEVPCAPCIRWDCGELFCLRSLSVAEVADAVDRALARGHDGDGRLQVTRSRESWETLAASGFELPLVSVVLGTGSWAGTADFQQELGETLLAVQAQQYPAIDLVAVLPDGMSLPEASGLRRLEPRIVPVPSDADDVWSAALVVSRGAFIAPIAPGIRWTPGKIGADVAYLQRHPNAELSSSGLPAGSEHARHFGFSTFRRPAFERWIEHGRWTHDAPSVSGTPTATASNPV
jgi:hypothetical protein